MSAMDERGSSTRVLIVDDSVDTARMMKVLLKQAGYDPRTANDGEDALKLANDFIPGVVLLDLTLPGISGQEVAAQLRDDTRFSDALIVAVSGYGDQGVPLGFDHLLVKPVDHDALKAILAEYDARHGLTTA
jgi:two-component system, OmpR family, response regulator